MIRDWILAAALTGLAVVSAGCETITGEDASLEADLGEIVDLDVGDTVTLNDAPVRITFLDVTADSRCPADVVCSEAGVVTGLFGVDAGDGTIQQIEITLDGFGPVTAEAGDYEIELLEINPYPTGETQPGATEYTAAIAISE